MKSLRIFILISVLFIFQGDASIARKIVNEGDEVPVHSGNATEIKRTVEAGEQTFYFTGEHKGKFVDSDGKEVDSSNYEIRDGTLIIKKFSKADVGGYRKHPNRIMTKHEDGTYSSVPGSTLYISIKE